MLTHRYEHGCVTRQGKVYIVGGFHDKYHGRNTWTSEVFSPPKNVDDPNDMGYWTYIAELKPVERRQTHAIVNGYRFIFIGK